MRGGALTPPSGAIAAKGRGTRPPAKSTEKGESAHDLEHSDVPSTEEVAELDALGKHGKELSRRNPFYIGLMGALGVLVAYILFRVLSNIGIVLELIGVSLFLAIGLNPAVVWLTKRRLPRWAAVVVVVLIVLFFIGGFVLAAIGPISREIHELQVNACRSGRRRPRVAKGGWGTSRRSFTSPTTSSLESSRKRSVRQPSPVEWLAPASWCYPLSAPSSSSAC